MIGTLNGQDSLRPQIGGGAVVRTSNGVVCENDEVPTIRQKMCDLTRITDKQQLQHLKISRYIEGQQFSKHTDSWPTEGAPVSKGWVNEDDFFGDKKRPVQGCWSAMNQPDHNNFMTCLVYLNDIPQGKGGSTTFPNIGLHTGKNGQNFYEFPAPMEQGSSISIGVPLPAILLSSGLSFLHPFTTKLTILHWSLCLLKVGHRLVEK